MPEPPSALEHAKRHAPATLRNRQPIADVLARLLPGSARVLEIAAGTGEHAVSFARALPQVIWQPTDIDPESLASITAHAVEAALPNLRAPQHLDASSLPWPAFAEAPFDAVVAINMIHIAPWPACVGLMAGAAAAVRAAGLLVLYGPFMRDGLHTAASNADFDASLKAMDPRFGVRDLAEVTGAAASAGFVMAHCVAMPANNLTLVFARSSGQPSYRVADAAADAGAPTPPASAR